MLGFWILILLLILLVALIPTWPYSRTWGYYPGGIVVALLILWLALIWFGYIAVWYPWEPVAVVEPGVVEEGVVEGAD